VELKNGDTYNGHLVSCDNYMNISLADVICTSKVRRASMGRLRAVVAWSAM
jgi:small nuclear ribonucleoprotein (snRNP)-like protein